MCCLQHQLVLLLELLLQRLLHHKMLVRVLASKCMPQHRFSASWLVLVASCSCRHRMLLQLHCVELQLLLL